MLHLLMFCFTHFPIALVWLMCGIPTKCAARVNKAYVWYPKLFRRLPLVNALEETFRSFFVTIEDKKAE